MPDAAYYRAWRESHPEYMERERARSRSRQRSPEQRRAERERAKARKKRKDREKAYDREWMRKKRAQRTEHERRVENTVKRYKAAVSRHIEVWRGNQREQKSQMRELRARKWFLEAGDILQDIIKRDDRTDVYDPLYEDAYGECIALLMHHRHTHKDKRRRIVSEAVREYVRNERRWRWHAQALPDER